MNQEQFINILLGIVAFVGAGMFTQLMRIAKSVGGIREDIRELATDHRNLKEDHHELKSRVKELENNPRKNEYIFKDK